MITDDCDTSVCEVFILDPQYQVSEVGNPVYICPWRVAINIDL